MPDLPRNGELLALAEKFPTNQALADHLGVPRTTLRDHIQRLGLTDAVATVRDLVKATTTTAEEPAVEAPEGMRLLLLDIETKPALAYVWRMWDENIGLDQLVESVETLCWAAKWVGQDDIEFRSIHHDGKRTMVDRMWTLLDEADAVIHYNGKRFDIPHLNRDFLAAELTPPSPYQHIDLLGTARKKFKFQSNKLAYVSKALGLEGKVGHEGFRLWVKCMAGDPDAWERMREYNVQDMVLLEDLYKRLLPWIDNHPSYGAMRLGDVCPRCGGEDLQRRGFTHTKVGKFQRYRCASCGGWLRDTLRVGGTKRTDLAA